MNGEIINVCKPVGMSSFNVISIARKYFGIKKIGYLGTLDPLACGVLVLMIGSATKQANELSTGRKTYRSIFTFGIETATLDNEGEVIFTDDKIITKEDVQQEIQKLVGEIEITVPKFSAVHVNGKRAYDLARKGIDFTPPTKKIDIFKFELLSQIAENKFFFEIECSTGTYIRSIAKKLAINLGTVAIASLIIRTKVGNFNIEESISLDTLRRKL